MADKPEPRAAGKSSFDLIDAQRLFEELALGEDTDLLDLGSGVGNYSLAASQYMGEEGSGRIFAADLWREGIEALKSEVERRGIGNIVPMVVDVGRSIPLEDETIDVCLVATVLHDLAADGVHGAALSEVNRVLRAEGTLYVVEFKKMEGTPGPSMDIRLAPEELQELVEGFAFKWETTADLGAYHYLSVFRK